MEGGGHATAAGMGVRDGGGWDQVLGKGQILFYYFFGLVTRTGDIPQQA